MTRNDLTNQKFGRLMAQWPVGRNKSNTAYWLCLCDCGKLKVIRGTALTSKVTVSCGCYNKEISAVTCKNRAIHGLTGTPEYHAYQHARRRCTNKKDIGWPNYGGRGIEFHLPSFPEFMAVIGHRPTLKHSLDRIDNSKHYTLDNIRWATKEEQMANRREYLILERAKCAKCGSTEFVRKDEKLLPEKAIW